MTLKTKKRKGHQNERTGATDATKRIKGVSSQTETRDNVCLANP